MPDPTLTSTSMTGAAKLPTCDSSDGNAFSDLINKMPHEYCYLHKLDNNQARDTLWGILKNQYDTNTNKIIINQNIVKSKRMRDKIKNLSSTEKRQIEIENYNYEKTLHQLVFLRNALIVLLVLIIVPILKVSGIIDLSLGIPLFFGVLIILALYGVYELYYKSLNRDSTNFRKYNFVGVDMRTQLKSLDKYALETDRLQCDLIKEDSGKNDTQKKEDDRELDALIENTSYKCTTPAAATPAAATPPVTTPCVTG